MQYAAKLNKEKDITFIRFRDIPQALTQVGSDEDITNVALNCLATAFQFYFENFETVPPPTPLEEEEVVIEIPLSIQLKILLHNAMVEKNVGQEELALRLGIDSGLFTNDLERIKYVPVDLYHRSLSALGYGAIVVVAPVA